MVDDIYNILNNFHEMFHVYVHVNNFHLLLLNHMIHNLFHQVLKNYFQLYHNQLMMMELTKNQIKEKFFKNFVFRSTSGGSVISSVNCVGGVGANKRSIITFCFMRRVEIYAYRERQTDYFYYFFFLLLNNEWMMVSRANKRKRKRVMNVKNKNETIVLLYSFALMYDNQRETRECVWEKKIFIDEPEKRTREEKEKESSRFWYGDACWIRSSWDLITSILKRVHIHIYVCSATVCVCVFTNDKPKSTDQCMRKASGQREKSGEEYICQSLNCLTNKKKESSLFY